MDIKALKLSPKMREELEYAAHRDEMMLGAYPKDSVSRGYVMPDVSPRTRDALLRRGLITFTYSTLSNPHPAVYRSAVLTVAGWAVVRPNGRPADGARLTLAEALEEAYAGI